MQNIIRHVTCGLVVCGLLLPAFAHAEESRLPYLDIGKHWAKQSIIRSVQAGLFAAGGQVQHFYPEREMTRAEFLTLLDRLFFEGQSQLYPLTFLSEHDEYVRGEGLDQPYLPYTDVDRLTWMYGSILRSSIVLDRLYGPQAIQQVFPGSRLNPQQPITRGEAARLLQMFTLAGKDQQAWEAVTDWGWLNGKQTDRLKRGEAAVMTDKLYRFLQEDVILPLLDYDGTKFPTVPQIREMFPLFAVYAHNPTKEEQSYIEIVEAIRNHDDDEQTFVDLKKLAQSSFPNQIGVHYYLSWDPNTELTENLEEAFAAIDAYFADKIVLPDTLRLLAANVYDISLQLESDDPTIYEKTLERMLAFEKKMKQGSKEWQSLAFYLGALEIKSGKHEQALARYRSFADQQPVALLNAVYCLVHADRLQEAEELLAAVKPSRQKEQLTLLRNVLIQELATLQNQSTVISDLAYTIGRMETLPSFKVKGESILSGYLFKYTQEVDQRERVSYTTGFYHAPNKLVPDKLEMYSDDRNQVQYLHEFDRNEWTRTGTGTIDYMHEWVEGKSIYERAAQLHARYYKQSFGAYDVITEWIPGAALREQAKELDLGKGSVKQIPVYMNKYYIDRETDMLVQKVWRYEEIYDSQEYIAYVGKESFGDWDRIKVRIPETVVKGAIPTP
ncbi:tetratricopeptide repeat protein [Brevibacillus sp. H7]|uniref:tetratricopeptide repeat protein n=1 Tax=Brevibacillus sp. H7 TaxID=3349138 RepID=UPI00381BBF32